MPATTFIRRHPDAIATEIDGEVVVMSISSGLTFALDRRASRIWTMLERPNTLDAIVSALLKRYDTSPSECRTDVAAFIEYLRAKELVKVDGTES